MKAVTRLGKVQDGDHSLAVAKRTLKDSKETQADVDSRVLKSIEAFVNNPKKTETSPPRNRLSPKTVAVVVGHATGRSKPHRLSP
jgi:hypothetical protein